MAAMKFLETRTRRDQMVLMITAYFLLFAGFLVNHGVPTLIYLLVMVWLTTVGLLQLSRIGPLLPAIKTARIGGMLLVQAVPIMLILFILFPRLPGPLWGVPAGSSSARTGLNERMSPGDITDLGLSDEVAFRVRFEGRAPPPDRLYWRGPVLYNFDGIAWSRPRQKSFGLRPHIEFKGAPVNYRIKLEPHDQHWVLALDLPSQWPEQRGIVMDPQYQLLQLRPVRSLTSYTMTSYPEFVARDELSERSLQRYTTIPEGYNPRTLKLAQNWRRQGLSSKGIIGAALQLFRAERFYYTLTPPRADTRHTADEFLFEDREGFCEHYASAFTFLMRAAGIPARVVTGYQGGELNQLGDYYIIRQSDAHAWTEVWLGSEGWVRVDPTAAVAPQRIRFGLDEAMDLAEPVPGRVLQRLPWLRQVVLAWDAANSYWNDWVIGYGPEMQQDLMEALGFDYPDWRKLLAGAVILVSVMLIAVTGYLAWRYRPQAKDPASRWYSRFCHRLSVLGMAKHPDEGPTDFAARAIRQYPAYREDIRAITQAYVCARYETPSDPIPAQTLRDLVKQFKPKPA